MKKIFFSIEKDGFYGTYYENPHGSDCTVLGLFGDDPNDYMAKCGVKWLHKNGVNALCMSPGKKNYSHINMPLERYAAAIAWLKAHGTRKIGVMGMSTAGMDSLAAASYFPDITLTFGLTAATSYGRDSSREKRTAAANGLSRALQRFPGKVSLCRTCRLYISTRNIGIRYRKKRKALAISCARHACLLIPKRQGSIPKMK